MPITSSAQKALRVSQRKQAVNTRVKSQMKTAVKRFSKEQTAQVLREAFRAIDRAVKNNLLHKNTAARRKSSLARQLKQTSSAQ